MVNQVPLWNISIIGCNWWCQLSGVCQSLEDSLAWRKPRLHCHFSIASLETEWWWTTITLGQGLEEWRWCIRLYRRCHCLVQVRTGGCIVESCWSIGRQCQTNSWTPSWENGMSTPSTVMPCIPFHRAFCVWYKQTGPCQPQYHCAWADLAVPMSVSTCHGLSGARPNWAEQELAWWASQGTQKWKQHWRDGMQTLSEQPEARNGPWQ